MCNVSRYCYRANKLDYCDNLIRWGHTKEVEVEGIELNNREAIQLTSNKPECRKFLRENGIPVPTESETDFPVIGRSRYHKAGQNFFLCNSESDVERAKVRGAVYFSKLYPKKNEYRVHVGGGRVLLMSIKEGDKTALIWNKALSDFNFRHLKRSVWLNDEHLRNMCRTARKAIKLLDLDFGAVDIMADAGSGFKPYVISEVNTAPNLSPLAITKYVKYFQEALEEEDEDWEDEEEYED